MELSQSQPASTNINFVFSELLLQILENCPTPDLLGHRLVNQQWKEVATKIILKSGSLKLQFEIDPTLVKCRSKSGLDFYSFKVGQKYPNLCDLHCELDAPWIRSRKAGSMPDEQERTLPNFFRFMTTPSKFLACSLPINHFSFKIAKFARKREINPQLLSFVQSFGHKIKALTLDDWGPYFEGPSNNNNNNSTFPNFILQYTPNLEFLELLSPYYRQSSIDAQINVEPIDTKSKDAGHFTLSSLKCVQVHDSNISPATCKIIEYLFQVAPQLDRIGFPQPIDHKNLRVFPASKLDVLYIESLYLRNVFLDDLEYLEHLAWLMEKMDQVGRPGGVGVKQIFFEARVWPQTLEIWERSSVAIRQIFQVNRNSLEKINLSGGAGLVLQQIPDFPILAKVKTLRVDTGNVSNDVLSLMADFGNDDGSSMPPGNLLCDLLPNLEDVVLTLPNNAVGEDFELENLFPFWDEKPGQVKRHEVGFFKVSRNGVINNDGGRSSSIYAKMLNFCPEATTLSVWMFHPEPFHSVMPLLWNSHRHLTSLKLEFRLSGSAKGDGRDFADLDAALTGFPKFTVRAIYENWQKCGQWQVPEEFMQQGQYGRVNPSLLGLTHLKKLKLVFGFAFGRKIVPRTLISGVSAQFAFDLLPNLEVLVRIRDNHFGMFSNKNCPQCASDVPAVDSEKSNEWLELHKPLLSCPRVNLSIY